MKRFRAVFLLLATALPCAASAELPRHAAARAHEVGAKAFSRGASPFIEFPRVGHRAFPATPASGNAPPGHVGAASGFPGQRDANHGNPAPQFVPISSGHRQKSEEIAARIPECR